MRLTRRLAAFAAMALAATLFSGCGRFGGEKPVDGNSFAVKNVRVFDGTAVAENTTVVVRDGKIAAVDPAAATAGLVVIDGKGKTLLPGLIDAHVHAFSEDSFTDAARMGVTTVLDMFTNAEFAKAERPRRDNYAKSAKADLWSAGTLATSPGGHGTQFGMNIPTLTDPSQAKDWVAARVAEGSDYIKIVYEPTAAPVFTSISKDILQALVAEAHAAGKKAVVHISVQSAAREAVDAGADGLVHIFADTIIDDALVADMAARKVFVIPTLSVIDSVAGQRDAERLIADPRLGPFITATQREQLDATFGGASAFKKIFVPDNARENVRKLKAAGVAILAGTDAPNPGTAFGVSLHGELAQLVKAGLEPVEALAAATRDPAKHFDLGDRGRIAPGERADLVLVNGDPTTDIEATRAIARVFKNGFEIPRPKTKDIKVPAKKPALTAGLVSDFSKDLSSGFGGTWEVTTDKLANGDSTATAARVVDGATGANGALAVSGTVGGKFPWPWAGAGVFFSEKFDVAYDLSAYKKLTFMAKGAPRDLSVMFFTRTSKMRPAVKIVAVTETWTRYEVDFASVRGLSTDAVYGFAVTAGKPAGAFAFQIDDVGLE